MSEAKMISRRGALVEAELDGELVALNVDSGTCYGFNKTATRIWSLIEQPRSIDELRETLLREYEVSPADCERQLTALLGELQADGLIEISDPAA